MSAESGRGAGVPPATAPVGSSAPDGPLAARARAWLGVGVLVTLGIVAVNPGTTNIHGDGYYTYLWARSIVFDGDLDFERDYALCGDPWGMLHMPHGDAWNQWNPGPSLFWIPMLVWDRLTGHPALDSGDARQRAGCMGPVAERAVRGSIAAGLCTFLLAYLASRRRFAEAPALAGAFVATFLSPLPFYSALILSYGHAASACTSGVVVWLWERERAHLSAPRHAWRSWLVLGAAIGVAMLVRPQNAILAILPLFTWLGTARRALGGAEGRVLGLHVALGVAFALTAVALFSPQLWFWYSHTGELFVVPQSEHYMRWESPRIWQTLFSSQAGLLTWSPFLYTSVLGLALAAWRKETRSFGLPLLVLFAVHTYVAACVMDWWGGTAYPGRRFDSMVVPMAIGTATLASAILERSRRSPPFLPRVLAAAGVLVGAVWTYGAYAYIAYSPPELHAPGRSDALFGAAVSRATAGIWEHVGNPLALPASIPFALRYGLAPRAWDVAGAPELFFHHWLTMERSGFDWRFDFNVRHAELLTGFEADVSNVGARRVRMMRGEYARALVPIGWPSLGGLDVDVAVPPDDTDGVNLWAEIDGEDLGTVWVPPGPSRARLRTGGWERHEGFCVLRLRVVGGRIGMSGADLVDPDPTPAELQAVRNRETLARRRAWRAAWTADEAAPREAAPAP